MGQWCPPRRSARNERPELPRSAVRGRAPGRHRLGVLRHRLTGTFQLSEVSRDELEEIFGHGLSVPEMWDAIKTADDDQLQELVELSGERGSDPMITMTSANAHLSE